MPELPEVETVKRGLAPVMEGAVIKEVTQNRPNLRFPFPDNFQAALTGQKIISVGRRSKYLLIELMSKDILVSHLGMSGSFRIELLDHTSVPGVFHHPRSETQKHDHVVLHLEGELGAVEIIYNDPRRFGFMDIIHSAHLAEHKYFADMGIEPTGNALNGEMLALLFMNKSAPLKAALLDQKLIAGLGNIYVCEALWRSGLSPKRKASTLATKTGKPKQGVELLAQEIRSVIDEAIEAGGSSLRDHKQTDGSLGYFQHRFKTYGREGEVCKRDGCDGDIIRIVQSGRSTFYCPKCQR